MRVLLIEDDSAVAQSIELMLKSESFNVYTTDLGEEGVDLGKLYDYDIILLDLNLPDMSGYDLLLKLKEMMETVPMALMTGFGYDPGHSIVRARQAGLQAVLYKPFRLDQLLETVEQLVTGAPAGASSNP